MRSFDRALVVVTGLALACLGLGACDDGPGEGVSEEELEQVSCTIGVSAPGAPFTAATADVKAELDLGFQGFLFFAVRLRTEASGLAPSDLLLAVTMDGDAPFDQRQAGLKFAVDGAAWQSDEVLVFFDNGTPAELAGRQATISVKLLSATSRCIAKATVTLVDDDPCIHTGATPICPEGTEGAP